MNLIIVIAILLPAIYAFANAYDKYLVTHKVKKVLGYTALTGLTEIVFGLAIFFFLSWDNITVKMLLFPILAGVLVGITYYLYFSIMQKSDASYVVGFVYLFPLVVAILSYLFLKERLSVLAYLAVAIILIGVILLSVRARKIKLNLLFLPLLFWILVVGGYEFFVKVSTQEMPFMNGLVITTLASGFFILLGLFSKRVRKDFFSEFKNIKWAFLGEFITLLGVFTLFFAMSKMSATVVSAIASTQPLWLLFFERIAHSRFGKMTKDVKLLPKLGAILFIVLGVIILVITTGS